jgi:proteic killer suppression protein
MIRSFSHKGLERYFEDGTPRGIPVQQMNRIRLILGRLHASTSPQDMGLPGLHLHELKGQRRGTWSVRVTSNWRITFKFEGNHAHNVNLEDYH